MKARSFVRFCSQISEQGRTQGLFYFVGQYIGEQLKFQKITTFFQHSFVLKIENYILNERKEGAYPNCPSHTNSLVLRFLVCMVCFVIPSVFPRVESIQIYKIWSVSMNKSTKRQPVLPRSCHIGDFNSRTIKSSSHPLLQRCNTCQRHFHLLVELRLKCSTLRPSTYRPVSGRYNQNSRIFSV